MLETNYDFDSSEFNLEEFDDMDFSDQIPHFETDDVVSSAKIHSPRATLSLVVSKPLKRNRQSSRMSKQRNLHNSTAISALPNHQLLIETYEKNDRYFHHNFRSLLAPRPEKPLSLSIDNFPVALVRCLNSCDNSGLSNLLRASFTEDCAIGIHCFNSARVSIEAFLKFIELLDVVHPDRIYSISDTSIVNNRITALSTLTFTDCKLLYDYASKTTNDPILTSLFHSRADHLTRRFYNCEQSEAMRSQMALLVESDADLVVSGTLRFQIAFDEETNKATGFYVAGGLTSAHLIPTETC